ncbi:MAG: acyl-ACP--UDP-N-acetylglucosamine O-acyltransferase [Ignavibacteriae bacterium]|nr:MAG: acyl-ACP--UDP-N-acetylglucosamine O-acyltransferase [Ignavibacteriota bacterium]
MSVVIHPASVVSSKASLGDGVTIGPFCLVEDDVVIGANTELMSHVVVANGARIGADCRLHPGAVIATEPQDLKFKNEPTTAVIGDRTVIRECVTVNRGTTASGTTVVGSDCLIMAYAHVAHDCRVGDRVVIANSVQMGGHTEIGDWAVIGGNSAIHQFTKIGAHAMIGGAARVVKDIPPFVLAGREPIQIEALNKIGLKRRGFSADLIDEIDRFYDVLFRQGYNMTDGMAAYEAATATIIPEVQACIDFVRGSKRGIARPSR